MKTDRSKSTEKGGEWKRERAISHKKKDIKCEYKTGKLANDVCAHSNF